MPEGEATGRGDGLQHRHGQLCRRCHSQPSLWWIDSSAAVTLRRMTTETPQYLYLLADDLYRVGNSEKPRLENVRPNDIQTYERNGLQMVRANGRGISLGTEQYLSALNVTGWLWKIPAKTALPLGLVIVPDPDPRKGGHFLLCPNSDMTMDKYKGLLSELALHCERIRKI